MMQPVGVGGLPPVAKPQALPAALPPLGARSPGNTLKPLQAPPPRPAAGGLNPLARVGPKPVLPAPAAAPSLPAAPTGVSAAAPPTIAAPRPVVAPLSTPPIPTAQMEESELKAAERQLLAVNKGDMESRGRLLTQLAAGSQPAAWALYRKMREADMAEALPPVTTAPGLSAPAALALRRCVAWVEKQAIAHDLSLLRTSFGASGALLDLLNTLYLHAVSQLAQRTLAAAANAYAAQMAAGGGVKGGEARVDWPLVIREASAVCDALSGLAANLSAAAPRELPLASFVSLSGSSAMQPHQAMLVIAASDHVEQLSQNAIAHEERAGPTRGTWVQSISPAGKQCALLGSTATLIASLSLHVGGMAFGVLPPLDVALCEAIRAAVLRYIPHVASIVEACVVVARGLTAGERTLDGRGRSASLLPALRAAAADGALPAVCCSSLAKLRSFIEQIRSGELRSGGAGGAKPLVWSDAVCASKLSEAAKVLGENERRLHAMLCDGAATLASAPALEACAAPDFWPASTSWRSGERCSLPMQLGLTRLHVLTAHLGALGDPELASLLYARTLRRCATSLLRAYWLEVAPSEKRSPTYCKDLRLLAAFALAESSSAGADTKASSAAVAAATGTAGGGAEYERAAAAASAAAAAAAGVGPPAIEDGTLAVERQRLGQLALWLLSLYAVHRAPLPTLAGFMKAQPPSKGANAAADGSAAGQIGGERLPESSQAATAALSALALADVAAPADAPLKLGRAAIGARPPLETTHAKIRQAAAAPLPELEWAALLTWDAFPLRTFPDLVSHAVRRLPALQPAGLAAAACAKKPEEVEAAALESRNELVRMVGPASSAS